MNLLMKVKWKYNYKLWTILLGLLLVIDCVVTLFIGVETNTLILWVMDKYNFKLIQAMVLKLLYSIPFLLILYYWGGAKFTFFLYIGIYFILVGKQFI